MEEEDGSTDPKERGTAPFLQSEENDSSTQQGEEESSVNCCKLSELANVLGVVPGPFGLVLRSSPPPFGGGASLLLLQVRFSKSIPTQ